MFWKGFRRPNRTDLTGVLLALSAMTALAQINFSGLGQPPASPVPVTVHAARVPSSSDTVRFSLSFEMAPDVHIYAAESLSFKVAFTVASGLGPAVMRLPEPSRVRGFDGASLSVFTNGQDIAIALPVLSPVWHVQGYLQYQACNAKVCFLPQRKQFAFSSDSVAVSSVAAVNQTGSSGASADWRTLAGRFRAVGSAVGYQPADRFAAFLRDPGASAAASGFAGKSLWLVLLLTLLGGVALNLTPCVLPMLPITLAVIGAGAQASSKRRGFASGLVYGSGMALAYGVAGVVVILTGATFGALNGSAGFNLGAALVFALLGLAMFDIIHIDFSRFRSGIKPNTLKRGTLTGVFMMGLIAALLAGACVAPVIISVILYAAALYAQGNVVGLALPFVLGLGMALPWPFAGAGLSLLPKPGGWMTWVRNAFGILILIIAGYYAYTGVQLLRGPGTTATHEVPSRVTTGEAVHWAQSLSEGLAEALASKRPVLIDFSATWCKSCHAMDATTLRDSAVVAELKRYVALRYMADQPDLEPAKSVLAHFGVFGLPTYVVLEPR